MLPEIHVITIPSKGEIGVGVAKLKTCPPLNVIAVGDTPLNGKLPIKVHDAPSGIARLTNIAPSSLLRVNEPDVNVVVYICIN